MVFRDINLEKITVEKICDNNAMCFFLNPIKRRPGSGRSLKQRAFQTLKFFIFHFSGDHFWSAWTDRMQIRNQDPILDLFESAALLSGGQNQAFCF